MSAYKAHIAILYFWKLKNSQGGMKWGKKMIGLNDHCVGVSSVLRLKKNYLSSLKLGLGI